ncbi:hypothetical protein PN836_004125 [Ningiella sp. W23]|uniref:hypothetical protein n=1 Tax=Ningiella sp. W23 TaxID=3023715 RepID=UPI003757FEE3
MKELEDFDLNAVRRDAHRAIWVLVILNAFVLIFYLIDTKLSEFVFIALFVQLSLLIVWLLPVFLYQVWAKKIGFKIAIYQALSSYRSLMRQVSW